MNDETLYARFKHTVGCRLDLATADADGEWFDLDIYSESEDPQAALDGYIADEYGDVKPKKAGETLVVEDPDFGGVVRHYRLK